MTEVECNTTTLEQSRRLHDAGIDGTPLLYWCMYDETLIPVAEYEFAWKDSKDIDCYKAYTLGQLMNIRFKGKPENCIISIDRISGEGGTKRWNLNVDVVGGEHYVFSSPSLIECFVEALLKLK